MSWTTTCIREHMTMKNYKIMARNWRHGTYKHITSISVKSTYNSLLQARNTATQKSLTKLRTQVKQMNVVQ